MFKDILMPCIPLFGIRKAVNQRLAEERINPFLGQQRRQAGANGSRPPDYLLMHPHKRTYSFTQIQLLILKLLNPEYEVTFHKPFPGTTAAVEGDRLPPLTSRPSYPALTWCVTRRNPSPAGCMRKSLCFHVIKCHVMLAGM